MKPTKTEHLLILAQYWGQKVEFSLQVPAENCDTDFGVITALPRTGTEVEIYDENECETQAFLSDIRLLLKPLGEISDKDAEIITDLCYYYNTRWDKVTYGRKKILELEQGMAISDWGGNEYPHECSYEDSEIVGRIIDTIRELGYAYRHGKYSVKQLVEAGIYKLIN